MLSYRHGFHAGNFADLLKHTVLALVIDYLKQKPAPIRYIDTHAGAGIYNIVGPMAERTGEFARGIGSLDLEALPATLEDYREVIAAHLQRKHYPGSPLIAAELLREQDELRLFELHTTEFPKLDALFVGDRRVQVQHQDGYNSLSALLPVKNARALVLIDPSYETGSDYQRVISCVQQGYGRMPNGVFAIWYPQIGNPELDRMIDKISKLVTGKLWRFELALDEPAADAGMTAAGMLLINPPWVLCEQLEAVFKVLCPMLSANCEAKFTSQCLKQ